MRRLITAPSALNLPFDFKKVILLSFVFHVIAAYFTLGFHHYDEQFQVLEYVSSKLGKTPWSQLPWEYDAKIRPWFQPAVYYGIAKTFSFLNPSPATLAFLFRLFGSLLGFASIVALSRRYSQATTWLCLFFFLPFLHARTSSEGFAASLFALGFALSLSQARWVLFAAGVALGFAFESRFQMAISIAGLLGYQLYRNKKLSLSILAGLAGAFVCGRLIDYWGYETWTLTPWNYFSQNLVHGKASTFGTLPLWGYFQLFMTEREALIPVGLLLLLGMIWFWVRNFNNPLTWATLPFFVLHSLIPHKEIRFLYPVLPLAVVCLYLQFGAWLSRPSIRACIGYANLLLLIYFSLTPAKNRLAFVSELSRRFPESLTLYGQARDPFQDIHRLSFYEPKEYVYSYNPPQKEAYWYFAEKPVSPAPDCTLEYQTLPRFLKPLNFKGWYDRASNWTLFRCLPLQSS